METLSAAGSQGQLFQIPSLRYSVHSATPKEQRPNRLTGTRPLPIIKSIHFWAQWLTLTQLWESKAADNAVSLSQN